MYDVMEQRRRCSLVVTIVHGVRQKHIPRAEIGRSQVVMDVIQKMETRQSMSDIKTDCEIGEVVRE